MTVVSQDEALTVLSNFYQCGMFKDARWRQEAYETLRSFISGCGEPVAANEDGVYWVLLRDPGMVPQRKGPFDYNWALKFVREVMDCRKGAYITVLVPFGNGEFWPEDGGSWLSTIDRRSAPKYRRYWSDTKAAHGEHSPSPISPNDVSSSSGVGFQLIGYRAKTVGGDLTLLTIDEAEGYLNAGAAMTPVYVQVSPSDVEGR